MTLPIQQQIKKSCEKYEQMGIQLPDSVKNISEKEKLLIALFPQCFQKLSVVDALK